MADVGGKGHSNEARVIQLRGGHEELEQSCEANEHAATWFRAPTYEDGSVESFLTVDSPFFSCGASFASFCSFVRCSVIMAFFKLTSGPYNTGSMTNEVILIKIDAHGCHRHLVLILEAKAAPQ
jgi:hypothetical protein